MKIAILGAGYAGLAAAWAILHYSQGLVKVDIYDPLPIGQGASGLSSGLLNPYPALHARHAWEADKAINAIHGLLSLAAQAMQGTCILSHGLLRPALTREQIDDFQKCAESYPDVEWWSKERCLSEVKGLDFHASEDREHAGGLYIKNALTIDVPKYLEGLWQTCALKGAQHIKRAIQSLDELKKYHRVVCALGFATRKIPELAHLPILQVKGQILELRWPDMLPPLPFSLISKGYLVRGKDPHRCIAGATFERQFSSLDPDPSIAIPKIFDKILPFFPALAEAEVLTCRAGVRATLGRDPLPLVDRISKTLWVFTGLGAKGILYHAWLGERLAQAILTDDPLLIPQAVRQRGTSSKDRSP